MRAVFPLVLWLTFAGGGLGGPVNPGSGIFPSTAAGGVKRDAVDVGFVAGAIDTDGHLIEESENRVRRSESLTLKTDGESEGESAVLKAEQTSKKFTVSKGGDVEVNILAGSRVGIKVLPSEFVDISEDYKNPNILDLSFVCEGNVANSDVKFLFHRDSSFFTSRLSIASAILTLYPLPKNLPAAYGFENNAVTSPKINTDGSSPIPFTPPTCWKTTTGASVWKAKFSTKEEKVKFAVEIENDVIPSASVVAIVVKPDVETAGFGLDKDFSEWGDAERAAVFVPLVVGLLIIIGVVCAVVIYLKRKKAKEAKAGQKPGVPVGGDANKKEGEGAAVVPPSNANEGSEKDKKVPASTEPTDKEDQSKPKDGKKEQKSGPKKPDEGAKPAPPEQGKVAEEPKTAKGVLVSMAAKPREMESKHGEVNKRGVIRSFKDEEYIFWDSKIIPVPFPGYDNLKKGQDTPQQAPEDEEEDDNAEDEDDSEKKKKKKKKKPTKASKKKAKTRTKESKKTKDKTKDVKNNKQNKTKGDKK